MTTTTLLQHSSDQHDRQLKLFTQSAAVAIMALGALVLTGWALAVEALKSMPPGASSMKANTALGLVLAGAALRLLADEGATQWRRRAGLACAVVVTLLGLLTLGQYLSGLVGPVGLDFGIDQILIRETPGALLTEQPGRMGANAALCFVLSGGALLLLGAKARARAWLAQSLTLAALVIALTALVGYAYGVPYLSRLASSTSMALHTALAFVALSAGLLAARPRRPLMALLTSHSPGGILLRRMWPQAILLFALLGWLELLSARAGWYEADFGTALLVLAGLTLFSLLIWRAARALERLDVERKEAENVARAADARLQVTLMNIGDAVISTDAAGCISLMNPVAEELTGWQQAEAAGRPLEEVFHIINEQTRATDENPVTKVIREGMTVGLVNHTVLIARDGRETPIDSSGAPICNEAGQLDGVALVFRDITERKRIELTLAFLAMVQKDFAPLSSADEIMRMAGARIAEYLKLTHCLFVEINEAADAALVLHDCHATDAPNLTGAYRLADFHTAAERQQLAAGKALTINDVRHAPRSAEAVTGFESLGSGALITAPYVSNGLWKFSLSAQRREPYQWRADEIVLLNELAARIYLRLERAHAEERLRESEERFHTLFNSIDEGFCIVEMLFDTDEKPVDYRFVQANPAFVTLTGLANPVGKTARELMPDLENIWFETYGKVALTGEAVRFEDKAELLNRWFDVYASRLGDATSRRVAIVFNNITARKAAEEQINYQLALTQSITDNTQTCLLIMDEQGRCTFANHATTRITGFKPEELVGEALHYKIHHTRPDGSPFPLDECSLHRALPLQPARVGHEDTFVHQDGRFYPVRCAGSPIFKDGAPVGTVIEVQDITEEKRLLAAERKARELAEAANRLKDQFLATVSHELRTPLNHMLGWVVMLRGGQLAPEKAAEALATIERNVRAQNRLVEDLLDVSRIVTGKMQLLVQPVVPAQVVEAAVASARPAAEAKNIRLQVVLDSRASTVSGDPDRLQQIVWNLLSNAIKFTPKDGRVQVRLDRIHSHVEITVSDTGEGLAPEFLPYVFDRFSQADGSLKRKHGGLGLGLSIVRHLVELHGGEVSVASPGLGQGATFTVTLPLRIMKSGLPNEVATVTSAQAEQPVIHDPLSAILKGVRVLVVDDEADSRLLLIAMLAGSEAEVRTAGSMDEALKTLSDWRPDVLISDIGMPNGDGYDLIREIRQRDAATGQWFPAVALTAYARSEDRLRAIEAGFQMHVAKPVEPKELLTVIASLTGRLVTEISWSAK